MIQTQILQGGSTLNKRTRDRNQFEQSFVLQPKDDNHKVTIQSDLWKKWDVFYRFCRLHSVTGTVTGVISVSLLPLTSFGDLSPAFFVGLLKAVIPFAFVNIYVVTLNQLIDVGIDKINKPYLVLASGEYTMQQGKAITSAFGIMCLAMAILFQSPPLLYGIIIHFLVGTAYSVELPLLRWKTKPFLAALGIGLHAFNFQLAVFCHIQKYVLGRPLVHTKSFGFVLIFFILFATVLGMFKDISDVAGDQAYGNRTFSVRHGKKKVFSLCILILLIDYGFAVVTGALLPSFLLNKFVVVIGHGTLASLLWRRAKSLNIEDDSSVESFYMFLWKLPLLRWKTKPFLAALGIGLHAFNFQLVIFCHIQKYVLGRPLVHTKSFGFVLIFFILFATVLGMFKDISDVAGDQAYGNRTFSVRHGKKKVFSLCILILLIDYGFAVATGALLPSFLLNKFVVVKGHCTLASLLWRRAKSLNIEDDSSVESFYMFLWKLFSVEYVLIQFIR